jgi:threonyl-tRNA synthetase
VRVLPISDKSAEYAEKVLEDLQAMGVRATLDDSPERIQAKVKVATEMKIPYLAVVGPRDAEEDAVSVRAFGIERNLGSIDRSTFLEALKAEISSRGAGRLLDKFESSSD